MANNIGGKQGLLYQAREAQAAGTKASTVSFKEKNIGLISQASPSVSKQQSAQRLRHLLIDRFSHVPQQKIDELFNPASDASSSKSLRDRLIRLA
ncbi:hypothetical protein [Shewanella sp.]|uniref:hypothetical protein n=1 Tax=Shewanella sp. TaxID=50422 RepID=UPI0025E8B25D|nr:hypothetical protein [Shewanella sp.]